MIIDNSTTALRQFWHPVTRSEHVADAPIQVELLGEHYVVVRLHQQLVAYADRCPHRGARLSNGSIVNGDLACPYHGWRFGSDGACHLIPALGVGAAVPKRACLQPLAVQERYGLIWLAPEEPRAPIIDIAAWNDPTLDRVWLPEVDMRAGAAQFIDNFLDFAHFPFVHAGTFGNTESPLLDDYTVNRETHGLTVHYEHTIANHEDPLVATDEHPLIQPRTMHYQYALPFSALLRLELPTANMINAIAVFAQPVRVGFTRLYTVMLRNDCSTADLATAAVDYELAVLAEDLSIIEQLSPSFELDPIAQVHTRADRLTIEYRRLLREHLSED